MDINVTKDGVITNGGTKSRVAGVKYMSDEDAKKFLRDNEVSAIVDVVDGKVVTLAKSAHAITDEEQKVIKKRAGKNKGKT